MEELNLFQILFKISDKQPLKEYKITHAICRSKIILWKSSMLYIICEKNKPAIISEEYQIVLDSN